MGTTSENQFTNLEQAMQLAINAASKGISTGSGGPFGACVVREGEVIAVAHNTVLLNRDPTCHAEMNAIRQAAHQLGSHVLDDCVMVTTAEPCPMCLAAIYWARMKEIVVGVSRQTAAEYGFDDHAFYEQANLAIEQRSLKQTHGLLADECKVVFERWRDSGGTLY